MPQLDIATYASQVFWLLITFFSLYFISLKYILPSLSVIIKVREKKLQQTTLDVSSTEQKELLAHSDAIYQQLFSESRQVIVDVVSTSASWADKTTSELNSTALLPLNSRFLEAMASIAASKYLLLKSI